MILVLPASVRRSANARSAPRRAVLVLAAVLIGVGVFADAPAQGYPRRPVTLVVPFPPGAATDVFARAAGRRMSEIFGQQVLVLNRDGASGTIGTDSVVRSVPDGHTLLWGSSGPLVISPVWTPKLPYQTLRDLAPISLFAKIPFLLIVHPSVPAKNLKELVALAKARPGKLNFASSGTGGTSHLAGELFRSMAKIDIVHVPYKGTALFATELVAGQVDLAFAGPTTALPHVRPGRLRALATTGIRRSDLFPDVPTMAEAGMPKYEFTQWYGLLAPGKTPRDVLSTLHATFLKAMEDGEVKKRIALEGGTAAQNTPGEFAAFLKAELEKNAKMIREAGLKRE
ncbi:MAG: tripartite tricarboxylate transporter substrate binding protein [Betaproteobacteria bacterium]|nr:tripartite tricarboxylate transporter substrate binding protein [Betaproteobacteria bacterium]